MKIKAADIKLCMAKNWRLRNDRQRIILYKYDVEESDWRVISPLNGVVLSLFNGERTLKDVADYIISISDMTSAKSRDYLTELLDVYYVKESILIDSMRYPNGDWYSYNPDDFIVPIDTFCPNKRMEAPLSLLLMPFNSCNVDCRYCYAERKPIKKCLPIERWREIIMEAADAGVSLVSFSGGDPMLYPNITELLDILIERDFHFLISTKTLVTEEKAKELAEMGLGNRLFQISLDAWTPELADHMVRRNGYFKRAIKSIKNLIRQGINVRTNTVCTPLNYHEAPKLVRELSKIGVTKSSITTYGRSLYRHNDELFVTTEQAEWLRNEFNKIKAELPEADISFSGDVIDHNTTPLAEKEKNWEGRASCSGGISALTICADGRVILCEQMPHDDKYTIGNLAEQSLLEVWNSQRTLDMAFPSHNAFEGTVCYDCSSFDECHKEKGYCFRDALLAYGDVYQPAPNCPKAPPSVRLG